ncbi:SRPBCC family protein [Actinoallomurus sp. NPDC052274]|uniref:SRPBCC family protein n=1 Tax=Actinoallomurus sp. NPDC052274 TaxID=3155420 RepID=UPI0034395CB6
MSSVMESIDVHVPVHTAYNQWTQFEDFPQFMEGVEEIHQVNDTLTHWKVKVAGASREYDAQITEQRPDERIAWTSVEEPKNAGVVTFHRLDDDNTRIALQLEVEPEGIMENVADKMGLVKHRAKNDLKRFKEFIEERGTETGAWRGNVDRPDQ